MNVIGISKDFSDSISELLVYCTCQSSTFYNCTVTQLEKYAKQSYRAFIAIWKMWPICGSVHAWVRQDSSVDRIDGI